MKKRISLLITGVLITVSVALVVKEQTKPPVVDPEKYSNIDVTRFKNGTDIFITPLELHKQLAGKDLVILDASHPRAYAKGHIPGAISIGFKGLSDCNGKPGDREWGTIFPKAQLTKKLESLGIDNTKLVVTYSDIFKGPGAGGRAVWQMKMAGLKNVRLLYGGLEAWKRSGYALSKESATPVAAKGLTLQDYDESSGASKKYIHDNLSTIKLVDVRSLNEYTGEDTSRGEARGGHIKGAKWLSWKTLLNDDTTVKSPREIIGLMAGIGITPDDDFVLY